jgi:hypothetical protein
MKAHGMTLSTSWDGEIKLTVSIDKTSAEEVAQIYNELREADIEVTVKKYRAKRSLDANAYTWQLLGQLAEKLETTSVELYLHYVRHYGIYRDFLWTEDEARTLSHVWTKQGIGWPIEKLDFAADGDRVIYRAYYGSSVYNTKQMSRLIDAVVSDCKEQGIETLTPAQLEGLKEEWARSR